MVFSTLLFLFRFLPITLALYYLAPAKWKNTVLFVCSLVFYSWGEVRLFPIMALAILINYTAGLGMEKFAHSKRARLFFLIYSIVGSIGMLMFFKYTNFFITNINALLGTSIATLSLTLPLGISFYTFQTMSYSIDVYRGDVPTEHNLIDFGAYVVMFPQLIAGPIVKYRDVSDRLHVLKGRVTMDRVEEGVYLFILGLAKKVLLADGISALWYDVTGHMVNGVMEYGVGLENASTPLVWLGLLAYTLQIYFDFSGYSLMAIGLGHMLGFNFPQNFNYPYIAGSITDFWRRWHMTLSSWFREYVYFPLGGSRCSEAKRTRNLFIVWTLTGFWHGASWNFVLWGLWFFVLLFIEKKWLLNWYKKHKIASHIIMPILFILSWVIFAISDFSRLGGYLGKMFGIGGVLAEGNPFDWLYALHNYGIIILLGGVLSLPVIKKAHEAAVAKFGYNTAVKTVETVLLAGVLLLSVAYLVDSTYNPFIYWNF